MSLFSSADNSAKHSFWYLVACFALGFTALSMGQVMYQVINYYIPDMAETYNGYSLEVLRFAISSLLVAGPIYFYFQKMINKALADKTMKNEGGARRWLTYLILLLASVVTIVSLVSFVNSYLSGSITSASFLKILVVLFLAGIYGSYYNYDMRRKDLDRSIVIKRYSLAFVISWVVLIAMAFYLVGSPAVARDLKKDAKQVSTLSAFSDMAVDYHRSEKLLAPVAQDILDNSRSSYSYKIMTDEFIKDLSYTKISDDSFQACGNFVFGSDEHMKVRGSYDDYQSVNWPHEAGTQCFLITMKNGDDHWPKYKVKQL
ncbi:hypothetical protein COB57_03975 [Candidatus Peregrinibacteria bacterium]|nr:MAG: hypothetical protein COB57_03975 [Candidatus Peregrinibacteria bacterium]